MVELAKRWRWSKGKVIRYLCELSNDEQIVLQKTNVTTLISIVNYEMYQGNSTADKSANSIANDTADSPQTGSQTDTNNNVKNTNNEKNIAAAQKKLIEDMIVLEMMKVWKKHNPKYAEDEFNDYPACLQIAYKIAKAKGWKESDVLNGKLENTLVSWDKICDFIKNDKFYRKFSLESVSNKWQGVIQSMEANKKEMQEKSSNSSSTRIVIP